MNEETQFAPDPLNDWFEFTDRCKIQEFRSDLTDMGNGIRFAQLNMYDVRYCHAWSKWLVWDGRRWELDATAEVERKAKRTILSLYLDAADECCTDKKRKLIIEHAIRSESSRALKAMLEMASSEYHIVVKHDALDSDKYLINLMNFTLDLRDLKKHSHRRDDKITKLANVEFNPAAECPKWIDFLETIFDGDQETIKYVQKACGYSLSGDIGEQKLFMLCGNGENGKSTFLDTIMAILGDYAMSCPTETFMVKDFSGSGPNNDIARLKGARFVTAAEIEDGKRLAESLVKQITGGDKIAARFLHQEFFEFVPEFKLWFCTNHKPDVKGSDRGMWRRIKIIPFNINVPKKLEEQGKPTVKNFHEMLITEESSGILNWMLQGWQQWRQEGLPDSQAIKDATDDYKAEMDILGRFIDECCEITVGAKVLYSELYQRYIVWCNDNGEKYPLGQRRFSSVLIEKGFVKKAGTDNKKFWHGITVTSRITEVPKIIENQGFSHTREVLKENPRTEVIFGTSVIPKTEPILENLDEKIKNKIKEMSDTLYEGHGAPESALTDVVCLFGYTKINVQSRIKYLLEIGEVMHVKEGILQVT